MSEFQDLRDEAKAWELSAAGSKDELAARIAEHRDLVALELGDHEEGGLRALAVDHGVEVDGLDKDAIISALVGARVAWRDVPEDVPDEPEPVREALKDVPETPRATTTSVWLGHHYVDIGSCAYKELIAMGLEPSEGPPDA